VVIFILAGRKAYDLPKLPESNKIPEHKHFSSAMNTGLTVSSSPSSSGEAGFIATFGLNSASVKPLSISFVEQTAFTLSSGLIARTNLSPSSSFGESALNETSASNVVVKPRSSVQQAVPTMNFGIEY